MASVKKCHVLFFQSFVCSVSKNWSKNWKFLIVAVTEFSWEIFRYGKVHIKVIAVTLYFSLCPALKYYIGKIALSKIKIKSAHHSSKNYTVTFVKVC